MGLTPLQERSEGLGAAAVAEYRGATAATRFSDPQQELAALRSSCAVYDLGYRAKISLTGGDRVRWLNGMVTNNIRDLAVGHGVYAFLLNPQGRILGDLYAYNRGESITVDTDRNQLEKILTTFDHYIIMDDVEVTDQSAEWTTLGIAGPKAREIARAAGIQIPESQPLQVSDAKCTCACACSNCPAVRGDDPAAETYELWVAPADVRKTWDALVAHGATPAGTEALELHRVLSGIPLLGVDIRERDLPQETEQARALNFNKGCYVGQEIVERIRSRGAVHRKFTGFLANGAAGITRGARISVGEKDAGEITSVAVIGSDAAEKTLALGYIRREVGAPGREVLVGSTKASVIQLPVADSLLRSEFPSLQKLPA
jgi:folate-binding protein YgfZ